MQRIQAMCTTTFGRHQQATDGATLASGLRQVNARQ